MKNYSAFLALLLTMILVTSCTNSVDIEPQLCSNNQQMADSIQEDYWPFTQTISKGDPFVSDLLASGN